MTSGSKYRIAGWRRLWYSGLFCSPPDLLLLVSGVFMAVGESAPGSVPREVA
jgi:hypothetical protein